MKKGRKHTNAEIQRILTDLQALMQQNVPDSQIRYTLGLGLRQYQYFARRINLQNQEIWRGLVKGELASELLKLRTSIENSYQTALALSKIPGLDTQDVLTALRAKDGMRSDVITLLHEGTKLLTEEENQQQNPKHHKSQSKIMQQLQPHP